MFLTGQGRQYLKTRGSWRGNPTLHSWKGLSQTVFLLNASVQMTWSADSSGLDDGFSGAVGNWGPEEAEVIPLFILPQITAKLHFEAPNFSKRLLKKVP